MNSPKEWGGEVSLRGARFTRAIMPPPMSAATLYDPRKPQHHERLYEVYRQLRDAPWLPSWWARSHARSPLTLTPAETS